MQEIAPDLWHWTAHHEHISTPVSSYYLAGDRVLIDPMIPEEGLDWFEQYGRPEHIVLSNRHHDRDSWRIRDAFGTTVHCISNGLYELEGRGPAESFEFGDELPGGIVVHEVDTICPDECALHLRDHRALSCADGIVRGADGGQLRFVPDGLMDEPEQTKEGLRAAYRRLLGLEFDRLLLAHGAPVLTDGAAALESFVGS
ncbi:MAG TPA: hypothetical protein VGI87_03075 [Solirubrobacteraceae bacterium]